MSISTSPPKTENKFPLIVLAIFVFIIVIISLILVVSLPNSITPPNSVDDSSSSTKYPIPQPYNGTPFDFPLQPFPNTTIAFVGDQAVFADPSYLVIDRLNSIFNLSAIVVLGDFDYIDQPSQWETMMDTVNDTIMIVGVIGNHDVVRWNSPNGGYERIIKKYMDRFPGRCECNYIGIQCICNVYGVFVHLSGAGTYYNSTSLSALKNTLNSTNSLHSQVPGNFTWDICALHMQQALYQTGYKANATGWDIFETCRNNAAPLITGHEHAYSRTMAMSNFKNYTIFSSNTTDIELKPNVSFCIVSGLGGRGIRYQNPETLNKPYWAYRFNLDTVPKAEYGALVCTFHIDNNPKKARCHFLSQDGVEFDPFYINRE